MHLYWPIHHFLSRKLVRNYRSFCVTKICLTTEACQFLDLTIGTLASSDTTWTETKTKIQKNVIIKRHSYFCAWEKPNLDKDSPVLKFSANGNQDKSVSQVIIEIRANLCTCCAKYAPKQTNLFTNCLITGCGE